MSLLAPGNGVRYVWHEPHPYIYVEDDSGPHCEVCGVQPRDRHPEDIETHTFKPYLDRGWRMCVHCGYQRVHMRHPDEQWVECGQVAHVFEANFPISGPAPELIPHSVRVVCTMDMERYPEHVNHTGRIAVYDSTGRMVARDSVCWRNQ